MPDDQDAMARVSLDSSIARIALNLRSFHRPSLRIAQQPDAR